MYVLIMGAGLLALPSARRSFSTYTRLCKPVSPPSPPMIAWRVGDILLTQPLLPQRLYFQSFDVPRCRACTHYHEENRHKIDTASLPLARFTWFLAPRGRPIVYL